MNEKNNNDIIRYKEKISNYYLIYYTNQIVIILYVVFFRKIKILNKFYNFIEIYSNFIQ